MIDCLLVDFTIWHAGPVHAAQLAEETKIPQVVVPSVPGVLSTMGIHVAGGKER